MKPRSGKAGFVIKGNTNFRKAFAAASGLTITRGDTVVDDLSLKGSGAALVALSRCVSRVRAKLGVEAREKARFAHIAKDPFAADPSPPSTGTAKPASPRTPAGSWITNDDYPAAAIREQQQGTTGFRLSVDATGKVADCVVTSTSGSPVLDSAACSLLRRRARFTPAEDANGEKIPSMFVSRFRWELPKN